MSGRSAQGEDSMDSKACDEQGIVDASKAKDEPPSDSKEITIKDDSRGFLIYNIGDTLNNRYEIIAPLGQGTFGHVVKAYDKVRNMCVAIKIIKSFEKYRAAGILEVSMLRNIAAQDPYGDFLCVKLEDYFDNSGHICIVFGMLGLSVYDFLRLNNFEPYSLDQVRHIGYQLCLAVKFLHENHITHTDLKPENMMFVNSAYTRCHGVNRINCTDIRLIDFGSATYDDGYHYPTISTRLYRAPEVILQLPWSNSADLWSIGCILLELYTGQPLFLTNDNLQHLAMMECTLGPMPYRMARNHNKNSRATSKYYLRNGKLNINRENINYRCIPHHCMPLSLHQRLYDQNHCKFFRLIEKMLRYEPRSRITAAKALKHSFFKTLPPHQRLG